MTSNESELIQELNLEIIEDVEVPKNLGRILVSKKDWTVETILSQIKSGNINLNPKFQRRNVWNDSRRSTLIESLILGMPVPELILAEDIEKPGTFIVIDGKQRLLTIAGFQGDKDFHSWERPVLKGLKVLRDLNGLSFKQMTDTPEFEPYCRKLLNADLRTILISNFATDDILYDIFHRINTGSVSLSPQELRQALHKGPFADYLVDVTNTIQPIHSILELTGPDNRLVDVEIILRLIAIEFFGNEYRGNLKNFLDTQMGEINSNWTQYKPMVFAFYDEINSAIVSLESVFGKGKVGRRFSDGKWETRFNRALFEVQVYYFVRLLRAGKKINKTNKEKFVNGFKALSDGNEDFRRTITSSTKDINAYITRYSLFRNLVNESFKLKIDTVPVSLSKGKISSSDN